MTKEQIFDLVETFNKMDDPETIITRLLFSGGEPFLYWNWIKEIIEKYGHRFQYTFNTSGYLFTDEILEFLSHYSVNFVLSVDGNEALTNYLRPVNINPYRTGYFKKFKEIVPTLLYYFPTTPYRIIINPRYVDLIHEMYCEADRLGFKYFTCILDFESRPGRDDIKKDKKLIYWEDKHTEILRQQFDLILQDILVGFQMDIKRPEVIEINKVISFLFDQKPFHPDNLPCQLFNERSLTTLYKTDALNESCMEHLFPNLTIAKHELQEAYNAQNHKCMLDKNCPAFEYCALTCCPQSCLTRNGEFFHFDELECILNKVSYESAIKLLSIGNDMCANYKLYKNYLNTFNYPQKQEVF